MILGCSKDEIIEDQCLCGKQERIYSTYNDGKERSPGKWKNIGHGNCEVLDIQTLEYHPSFRVYREFRITNNIRCI